LSVGPDLSALSACGFVEHSEFLQTPEGSVLELRVGDADPDEERLLGIVEVLLEVRDGVGYQVPGQRDESGVGRARAPDPVLITPKLDGRTGPA